MFDATYEPPTPTTNPDGSVSWNLGFGITHTISAAQYAALQRGLALAKQSGPDFFEKIRRQTIPQLKKLCVQSGRSTRGFQSKQECLDTLMSWYTGFCLQQAGYLDSRR